MLDPNQLPNSYWAATAKPGPDLPVLSKDTNVEVVIIGAGFTGLSAAAEFLGLGRSCVVLEVAEPGWGASGRTGGFCVPRYKKGFAALAKKYGSNAVRRMHALVHEAIDTVEQTVEEFDIDCGFKRSGNITAAHGPSAIASLKEDLAWLRTEAKDNVPQILSRDETEAAIGNSRYVGSFLDPRGAAIHPLNYTRGLAKAVSSRGVPVYIRSPAIRLVETTDGVVVETKGGCVTARYAVIATNGYSEFLQTPHAFDRRVVPVASSAIVTAPLPTAVAEKILAGGQVVADTKHILNYYRKLPDGRMLFGGRGDITGRSESVECYRTLENEFRECHPAAKDVGIEYRWSGMVAVTLDNFPHLGWASPRVCYAMGYGGRGVALSNLLGRMLSKMVVGQPIDAALMQTLSLKPIPFHRWRVPAMRIVAAWYRFQDKRQSSSLTTGK